MKWFKFYGSDWLTDIKVMNMSIEDRLCFLTLLCLAANDENPGVIKGCDEEAIIKLTHLYEDPYNDVNEVSRARGFIKRFIDNKMITIDCYHNVSLVNFDKRQSKNLSGYERVKRCRERKKLDNIAKINDDNNDNAMITQVITSDKKRVDKNRIEKNKILSAKADKELTIEYINSNPRKDIRIIFLYARAKGKKKWSAAEEQSFIKRNLRFAKLLEAYPYERIMEVMKYLNENADFKWTIETIGKYIDENLDDLSKNNKTTCSIK